MINIKQIRQDFPFLRQTIHGNPVVFLDTCSSAQKPSIVIDSIKQNYTLNYANVHRGSYYLSDKATEEYENARSTVQRFIGAKKIEEIIFTKGTTESINLVANSLLERYLKKNDEIIITEMEHHANITPWHLLVKKKHLIVKYIPITDEGNLDLSTLDSLLTNKTKIISLTHCSNVLGTINPIKKIIKDIRTVNPEIICIVDGAQSVVHQQIDVVDLDCDFFAFSSHKLYGATGVGVLYARKRCHELMSPYQGGGDMIKLVTMHDSTFSDPPYKFEAGTPNIVGIISLSKSIEYIEGIGIKNIEVHEKVLLSYATEKLKSMPDIEIIGRSSCKSPIVTFLIPKFHSSDLGSLLDLSGICVRTGHHCAQPILQHYGVSSTIRISFGIYNIKSDIDILIKGLYKAIEMLS